MKHFKIEEFDSPDEPGSGKKFMKRPFLNMIDRAREASGTSYIITSGYRTKKHNEEIGGSPTSSHLNGWAADIACDTSEKRELIIFGLIHAGFQRIGIAHNFIHCDCDPNKEPAIWLYS